ncbi:hypothetical protein QQ045_020734 [Rhodiola kirilowii]
MDEGKKLWVEGLVKTNISSLPLRYLGFLLTTRSISSSDCSAIIQRLTTLGVKQGGPKHVDQMSACAYWTKGTHWWENDNLTNSSWVLRRLAACKQLSSKCVSLEDGRLNWISEGAGFNVSDTYMTLKSRVEDVDWHSLVWNRFNTPTASNYTFLAAHDRLLTRARLRSCGMVTPPECALCSEAKETRDHLFFCCRISRNIYDNVLKYLKVADAPCQWHLLSPWFMGRKKNILQTRMIAAGITASIYEIWKMRNLKIFRQNIVVANNTSRSIIWSLKVKVASLEGKDLSFEDSRWLNSIGG